ncbi:MAG: hypothetical protein HON90_12730 [Halobacteriovoraceae bacterium]|jgi:hypothetical protein|nr:hypothetical protein [Halobacteriovoraceae bacterium]
MSRTEKILIGKYNYFNSDQIYTQENFYVERIEGRQGELVFHSEVLSRVKNGEFLKINIEYQVSNKFDPMMVKITRRLGEKESTELFQINQKDKTYSYIFKNKQEVSSFERIITSLPHIAAPCFATSMIMVNQKKIDSVQRTPYTLLHSNNIWDYVGEFEEKTIYIEMQKLEQQSIMVNDIDLKATHCKLLSVNKNGSIIDDDHEIFLSKHYFIPYEAIFGKDLRISIETLKNLDRKLG